MGTQFDHISICAVKVLARLAAKKAVEAELRAKGVRTTLVKPTELTALANDYLAQHGELYIEARERAARLGMYEKPFLLNVTQEQNS